MKFNKQQILFICAHNGHRKDIRICHFIIFVLLMRVQKNTHKNMCNKFWHRVQPKKHHNSLQNRKIAFFHTDIYSGPDSSLCHKAYQKHKQPNRYVNCGPHKHHCNKQYTVQYVPTKYLEVPQFTGLS